MRIEISVDHAEGKQFVEWLKQKGHDAWMGKSTATYIDSEGTHYDLDANNIHRALWTRYCAEV